MDDPQPSPCVIRDAVHRLDVGGLPENGSIRYSRAWRESAWDPLGSRNPLRSV